MQGLGGPRSAAKRPEMEIFKELLTPDVETHNKCLRAVELRLIPNEARKKGEGNPPHP